MRLLIFLLVTTRLFAGEIKFPVSEIPEELKQNNYAVIRESVEEFKILAVNRSSYYVREAITILNSNGNFNARKVIGYDPLRKLQMLDAAVYDAEGRLIKKLKTSEIQDQSAFDGYSLYSDNRIKKFDLRQNTFPYTIFIEYQIEFKFLYFIPTFTLYSDDEIGIQKKSYSIAYPSNLKPRYKLMGGAPEPKTSGEGTYEKLSWHFENIRPDRWEDFSPDHVNFIPSVLAAPTKFEYEGYAGKMDTWESLGSWQLLLNKGRDVLPEATRLKIREMTNGKTDLEKVKTLYEYTQNKTRYVSVQLGIGGLQPFEAKVVDEVGYGDCKALSNYMVSLLKEVGIKGYYVAVNAGKNEDDVVADFPSDQSNHIIVAVPMEKDTIWLECTSQVQPFNFLGTFTGNRHALLITEEGGKLVRTPSYDKEKDVQKTKAIVALDNTGKGNAEIKILFEGMLFDRNYVGHYTALGSDKQKEWIQENIAISSFDISTFKMNTVSRAQPAAQVDLKLYLPNCATVQGKRLFLSPNLANRIKALPAKIEERKTNIVFKFPYTEMDSIYYTVPEEFYPEFIPQPVKISSRFGEYESTVAFAEGKLLYVRRMIKNSGKFPKETYPELVDFYKAINKADLTKVVFLNKT